MEKVRADIRHAEHCLRTGQPNLAGLYLRRGLRQLADTRAAAK